MNGIGYLRGQSAPTNPWVRPYVLTRGRTRSRGHGQLLVHTLVSASGYDPLFAARLLPEARALYERICTTTESVAELSAHCGVPLGVTRVLLGDLCSAGRAVAEAPVAASPYDHALLERVLDGLRQFA
jgi:Protein of unknown function (DUF742)